MADYKTDATGKATGWQLNAGQQVNLGFSAFGDVLSFFSSLNASNKQAFQYQFQSFQSAENAQIIAMEAKDILRAGSEEVNKMKEEGYRVRGEQRVAMGASGFDVASKSYQDILTETDRQIENNAATIRENTMSAYANKKYQQRVSEIQGRLYKKAAKISKDTGYGDLISAGIKVAALSYFGG